MITVGQEKEEDEKEVEEEEEEEYFPNKRDPERTKKKNIKKLTKNPSKYLKEE